MKIKQAVLSVLLAAAMVISSACGTSEQNNNITTSGNDTEAATVAVQETTNAETEGTKTDTSAAEESTDTAESASETVSETTANAAETTKAEVRTPTPPAATTSAAATTTAAAATTAATTTTAAATTTTAAPIDNPAASGSFQVTGTKLYDAKGNEFIMRGINHAHAWYQGQLTTALDGIAGTGANCVRVVLADGDKWGKTSASDVENIIGECEKRRLVAILEVHDTTFGSAGDEFSALDKAADYWVEMKDIVNSHTDTVIVNIANEWHNGGWRKSKDWADGYLKVIPKLREAGIKNTLMVDCDGNGQYPQSLFDYADEIFDCDTLKNTMFSIHMYEYAGKDERTIKNNIDKVLDKNLCLVIGEFGFKHTNGDIDEQYIMKYCTEKDVGYIGWSWKGNGGGVEYLDIAESWDGSSLSSDWGEILVNDANGIRATSEICSVFD